MVLARGLQRATADFRRSVTTKAAQEMIQCLVDSMSTRFRRIEAHPILSDAAALDPRFKRMAFSDSRAADEAFQRVSTSAARISRPVHQQRSAEEGAEGGDGGHGSIVWSYFQEEVRMETTIYSLFT